MDTLTVVLLVVIAAISILQTTFLVRLALEGRRTARGLERLADRIVQDLTPMSRDLGRAAANVGQVSEMALQEALRLDGVVQEATESWSRATARLYESVVPTFGKVALVASGWRLVRRALWLYRRFRG